MENTRLRPLPLMARLVGPGPRMFRFFSITSSPLVRPMVRPLSVLVKVIVPPGQTFEMASRNEPAPLSLVLVTVILLTQTITEKAQMFVPVVFVAVQMAGVAPTANKLPEGG